MERVLRGTLLALALTIGVIVAACAPAQVEEDVNAVDSVGRSSVQQATPGPDWMTPGMMRGRPTSEVRGARATPSIMGTPSPADIQATLNDMDQFRDQLRNLAGNLPTSSDLMSMTQHAEKLMAEFHYELPQMSPNEKDLAMSKLGDIMVEMGRVIVTYGRQVRLAITPGVMTPTPVVAGATPMPAQTMVGTPSAGPMTAQQLMMRIDQLRDQLMLMASGQPTAQNIVNALDSMQATITNMRQQAGSLSSKDLEALTGNMANATGDLCMVIDVYLRQTTGTAPTAAPTLSPSPSPSPVPTMIPIPSPTPTS